MKLVIETFQQTKEASHVTQSHTVQSQSLLTEADEAPPKCGHCEACCGAFEQLYTAEIPFSKCGVSWDAPQLLSLF